MQVKRMHEVTWCSTPRVGDCSALLCSAHNMRSVLLQLNSYLEHRSGKCYVKIKIIDISEEEANFENSEK
jgi:hypothetical protein